ncbi:MAG: hypothetical protein AAF739_00205 [Pseudomonadota bacterium]
MSVFGLTVSELSTIIGFIVGALIWLIRLQMTAKQNSAKAETAVRVARDARQEVTDLKLEIAEKYASVAHLKEVEARLAVAIDRLTDRIDQLLSIVKT